MTRSKLIIVEGAQGAGKTTASDYIRDSIPHMNLYRLGGTSDNTITGLEKSTIMYESLIDYIEGIANLDINLLFDRTFFSEENYCRQGFKEYSFTQEYNKLVQRLDSLDFDIYYITIYLEDTKLYKTRLERKDKAVVKYAKFKYESSISQQNTYMEMAEELKQNTKNIKVYNISNDSTEEELKAKIKEILSN